MLVLTRKIGESIKLSREGHADIIIHLINTGRNSARVGIEAPLEYRITREKLLIGNKDATSSATNQPAAV